MAILEQSGLQQAGFQQSGPLAKQEVRYTPPAEVFEYWYNRYRAEHPQARPPLKWLTRNSRLPRATCHWYRQRMEQAFPDAYAVARAGKNLSLSKRRPRSGGKKSSTPPPAV